VKDYRQLQVWQRSHRFNLDVYRSTEGFPKHEWYGLRSQIRRASGSIAANIAEGCGRRGDGDFFRFLDIAAGSASELDYHLLLARDLGYITESDHQRLAEQLVGIRRMLTALLRKVDIDRSMAKR
jgi:four helix bundle protein